MTVYTVTCPKELARIDKTAKNGKAWDAKMAKHREAVAPQLEANFNASYNAMMAAAPQWIKVEGVDVMQSPGSSFVAVPVSGRKNSRFYDIIDMKDRSDIVCQLTAKEVCGWLSKKAIAESEA
jgi:hypothetical protein